MFYSYSINMSKSQVLCLLILASAYLINANDFTNRSDAALSSNEEEGVDEIIGGATVTRGQHQYMAYLRLFYRYSPGGFFECGGTVISNRYILTAAHCVQDDKTGEIAYKVEVRLKASNLTPDFMQMAW
ncbi:spaetzle-processing enzyme-like [Daphnia pulicaria]|uniref:spaetzle-processing enzyme-like n=1 Tax=Daphnia pulicaria TaxID=35523 RepID=UPI001EEBC117|nr:spaetzle-processing enzyme-like [Daphnia pulicaria]